MMKKQIAALLVALTTITTIVSAQTEKTTEAESKRPFQMSFVYPLSTVGTASSKYAYNFSLNIIGGITGSVRGAEFGGVFNINNNYTYGAQFAGVFNKVNTTTGVQFAGVFNMANHNIKGSQFAGVFNHSAKGEAITQIAGITNVADSSIAQFSGIANVSQNARTQVAGIVNIAKKSKVQVGIVNISDTANIQIGLINLSKNGFIEAELAGGEFLHTTASFRSGTKKLYGIVSVGYNFSDEFWGYGVGIGTSFKLSNNWGVNLEGTHYNLATKEFKQKKYNGLIQVRPAIYRQLGRNVKLFAAPVANLYTGSNSHENQLKIEAPYSIWSENSGKIKNEFWVGFSAGVRISF